MQNTVYKRSLETSDDVALFCVGQIDEGLSTSVQSGIVPGLGLDTVLVDSLNLWMPFFLSPGFQVLLIESLTYLSSQS